VPFMDLTEASTLFGDFARITLWDPVAECSMTMATPYAEPDLFEVYHRGAVQSYARFGVSDALDSDVERCAADTGLFWTVSDIDGRVVGGVRAKGPLRSPEESHALVEWAGQRGEGDVYDVIAERIPMGILEMKAAWLSSAPDPGRHRAKMLARSGFHAMSIFDIGFCMATSAAHILEQWRSSGGVVSDIPATPYPDERYQTKMMWWDRRTFTVHGEPEQVATICHEMSRVTRNVHPWVAGSLRRAPLRLRTLRSHDQLAHLGRRG
jgi:hypothetical protein